jgi:predicted transcriptional regulator
MAQEAFDELLAFFKALGDKNRLTIVGLLAQKSRHGEELSAILDLAPATISHHLRRLTDSGLVDARPDGHYIVYSLRTNTLEEMATRLLSEETQQLVADDVDFNAYDRHVLESFLEGGRLKTIPSQRKKREVILRHLAKQFDTNRRYTEAEVNEVLEAYHEDVATLRRELIGYELLQREHGTYWRPETSC